jgi:hypothetical protein
MDAEERNKFKAEVTGIHYDIETIGFFSVGLTVPAYKLDYHERTFALSAYEKCVIACTFGLQCLSLRHRKSRTDIEVMLSAHR